MAQPEPQSGTARKPSYPTLSEFAAIRRHLDELAEVQSRSVQEQVSNELVKQIRKLRWIGLDAEAKSLESALRRMEAADVVLSVPPETD